MSTDDNQLISELSTLVNSALSLNLDAVTMETSIMEDLGIDSLSVTDLVLAVEEKYGFEFEENDLLKIKTVGDVVGIIKENSTNS